MARKKTYSIDDIASVVSGKKLTSQKMKIEDVVFEVAALTEKEMYYLQEEIARQDTTAKGEWVASFLTSCLGIKGIYKLVNDEEFEVKLKKDTVSMLGEDIEIISPEIVQSFSLSVKKQLTDEIMKLTQQTLKEGMKLELFR